MTRHRSITLFACVCIIFLCDIAGRPAQGQSLGMAPALVEAKVKRGATYSTSFTIDNNTGTRLRFRCSVGDYWYDEHNLRVTGRPGTLPRSASLWVQFSPAEAIVEPHSSATVRAIITVPEAAAGSYYTTPIFEGEAADPSANAAQSEGAVVASVAVRLRGLMMLTTEDASEYNVEIMGGSVTPPSKSSALEMQLDVRNRSTAHARLRGIFAIVNGAGGLAGRGRIDEKTLLPGQHGGMKAQWAGDLAPGHYTAIITLTYDRAGMGPATLIHELLFDVK